MKFILGDKYDTDLVEAMTDEAEKCIHSFELFEDQWTRCFQGEKLNKQAHDAYFEFVRHLYEFYKAALVRQYQDDNWVQQYVTEECKASNVWDGAFATEAHRLLNRKISSIQQAQSPTPTSVLELEYFQELMPLFNGKARNGSTAFSRKFGSAFRKVRNNTHVLASRKEMDLIGFLKQYHGLIYLLFEDLRTWKNSCKSSIGTDFKASM